MELTFENVIALAGAILVLARVYTKLTPTDKDDKIVAFVDKIFNLFLPDRKKGGGKH